MKYEHSSGPWHVDNTVVRDMKGCAVAWCARPELHGYDGCEPGHDEANARLIAATPEMLDVLENLVRWCAPVVDDESGPPLWDRARAIIKKATVP